VVAGVGNGEQATSIPEVLATATQPNSPLPTSTEQPTSTPTATSTSPAMVDSTNLSVEPKLRRWVSANEPTATGIPPTPTPTKTCKPRPWCACLWVNPCKLTPPEDGIGWCECRYVIFLIRKNYLDADTVTPTSTPMSTPTPLVTPTQTSTLTSTSTPTATSTGTIPFYIPVIFKKYGQ